MVKLARGPACLKSGPVSMSTRGPQLHLYVYIDNRRALVQRLIHGVARDFPWPYPQPQCCCVYLP